MRRRLVGMIRFRKVLNAFSISDASTRSTQGCRNKDINRSRLCPRRPRWFPRHLPTSGLVRMLVKTVKFLKFLSRSCLGSGFGRSHVHWKCLGSFLLGSSRQLFADHFHPSLWPRRQAKQLRWSKSLGSHQCNQHLQHLVSKLVWWLQSACLSAWPGDLHRLGTESWLDIQYPRREASRARFWRCPRLTRLIQISERSQSQKLKTIPWVWLPWAFSCRSCTLWPWWCLRQAPAGCSQCWSSAGTRKRLHPSWTPAISSVWLAGLPRIFWRTL